MINKKIHLVHVGKCAGESIQKALYDHGIPWEDYHCGQSNDALASRILADNTDDYFIVLLRDPVSRFVSAFEWDLVEKILPEAVEKADQWERVYAAFPSASSLGEGLTSSDADLRQVAEFALSSSELHMQFDLGWYLPPHIAAHLHTRNAFAVRIEHINDDFTRLLTVLEVPKKSGFTVPFFKNDYKSRIPRHRITERLSERAARNVRLYSASSYETIRILSKNGVLSEEIAGRRGFWSLLTARVAGYFNQNRLPEKILGLMLSLDAVPILDILQAGI